MRRSNGCLLVLLLAAMPVAASWLPDWSVIWQSKGPLRSATVWAVRADEQGRLLIALNVTRAGSNAAVIARLNADGSLRWSREQVNAAIASVEWLDNDRVALLAQGETMVINVYDAQSGELIWSREVMQRNLCIDYRVDRNQLAMGMNGDLLVRARDNQDFVVIRFDRDGNALPEWRWSAGSSRPGPVCASEIVALADGGAIVSGQLQKIGGGYGTVRFHAMGLVRFSEVELGDIGNPLGPSHVLLDSKGNIFVSASPESSFGVPAHQIWKLTASGERLWLRRFPDPSHPNFSLRGAGLLLDDEDDVLVTMTGLDDVVHLLRIDWESGDIERDTPSSARGEVTAFSRASNGRVLIGSTYFIPSAGGDTAWSMAEFAADGNRCRWIEAHPTLDYGLAKWSDAGWLVVGSTAYVAGLGSEELALRYDSNGPCMPADAIFRNGFED
jgi:hypothetical protein